MFSFIFGSTQGITPQNLIAYSHCYPDSVMAFTLSMLSKVDPMLEYPQCLCVCPDSLHVRVLSYFVKDMAQFTKIKIHLIVPEAGSKLLHIITYKLPCCTYFDARIRIVYYQRVFSILHLSFFSVQ